MTFGHINRMVKMLLMTWVGLAPTAAEEMRKFFLLSSCTLQVFKHEPFAYNASSEVIQAEQMADAQLKALVQEWETMLDSLKLQLEGRVTEELNPTVYPQVRAGLVVQRRERA